LDGKKRGQSPKSDGKKKEWSPNSALKKKVQPPNSAGKKKAQSTNVQELSTYINVSTPLAEEEIEEEHHNIKLFYEQLQLYYSTANQRKLMG
jgi:hypothetical protein